MPTVSLEKFTSLIWPSLQDATIVTLFALMVLILSAVSVPVNVLMLIVPRLSMREMFSWPLKLLMAMVARLSMRETFSCPAKLLMAMVPRFATRVTSRLPLKV